MSVVLFEPVSPSKHAINPKFQDLLKDPEFKNSLKGLIITLLEEDQEFRESLRSFIDCSITMSEFQILKRLSVVETELGYNNSDFEDEYKITIPEQLSILAKRIETITAAIDEPVKEVIEKQVINPKTTLEHKAAELVEHLKTKVNPRNGEVFLNSREIITVLKHEIPEEYRLKDIQNPRQAKKDIIEKAKKLFSDFIVLDRKKHGNRDVRIVYKPKNDILNMKRMGTYIHL